MKKRTLTLLSCGLIALNTLLTSCTGNGNKPAVVGGVIFDPSVSYDIFDKESSENNSTLFSNSYHTISIPPITDSAERTSLSAISSEKTESTVATESSDTTTPKPTEATKATKGAYVTPDPSYDYVAEIKNILPTDMAHIQMGMINFKNGYRYSDGDEIYHPASTIKVYIMDYVYNQAALGNVDLYNTVYDGQTLYYYVYWMVADSKNECARALIRYFGQANIDEWLRNNYTNTRLRSNFAWFDSIDGLYNTTTVNDALTFLEKLYYNRNSFPYNEMIKIMKGQTHKTKIQRYIYSYKGVSIASKTGWAWTPPDNFDDHDLGIIFTPDTDFALVFLCKNLKITKEEEKTPFEQRLGKVAKTITDRILAEDSWYRENNETPVTYTSSSTPSPVVTPSPETKTDVTLPPVVTSATTEFTVATLPPWLTITTDDTELTFDTPPIIEPPDNGGDEPLEVIE